ncbi:hypothetical protein DPMN_166719 [Dreissena polymorpha]|uniref:Uncharacterized protein n=1 Tax=Dreissena polymorpha TaxID=45954 RepID=A0A9D4EXE7_DREPO|nr:hypothetical protein DPMN_166719 [Dreissena polymorpha]
MAAQSAELATPNGFLHASFVGGQNTRQVWFSPGTPVFIHSTRPHQNKMVQPVGDHIA